MELIKPHLEKFNKIEEIEKKIIKLTKEVEDKVDKEVLEVELTLKMDKDAIMKHIEEINK